MVAQRIASQHAHLAGVGTKKTAHQPDRCRLAGTVRSDQPEHLSALDIELVDPEYFTVGTVAVPSGETDLQTGWELELTRVGASAGYGAYTVVFNQDGFDPANSTIQAEISPLQTSGS